jgi:23S rRNA (guanosine2251-2'-O)-methyltransferase
MARGLATHEPGLTPEEALGPDEEVVAGRRPVEEAFAARRESHRLLVVPERRGALEQLVLHATTLRIPVVEVEGGTLTAITGFDGHQGIALVVAPRRMATLDEVLAIARARGEPPFLLVLDHLEDPQNVGALLRSAEASGIHGVILPAHGTAPVSAAAIKSSAGAVEHLALVTMADLAAGLADLHARGLRIVGADGEASLTVREVDLRGPLAIVIGNEGRGLTGRLRRRMDVMARIPMRGRVASLNASVAGSILLYEAASQRAPAAPTGGRVAGQGEARLEEDVGVAPAASDIASGGASSTAAARPKRSTARASTPRTPKTAHAHPSADAASQAADERPSGEGIDRDPDALLP